jgi:hypothetical protein
MTHIIVTGASSGMGLATARAFAEAGTAVTLADVNDRELQAAERELRDAGHRVLAVRCDVSDEDQVAGAVAKTVETFGSLDLAYNNADVQSPITDAADETAEVFDRVNAINLRGWASMKHELAQMRTQGSGAIVTACLSLPVRRDASPFPDASSLMCPSRVRPCHDVLATKAATSISLAPVALPLPDRPSLAITSGEQLRSELVRVRRGSIAASLGRIRLPRERHLGARLRRGRTGRRRVGTADHGARPAAGQP